MAATGRFVQKDRRLNVQVSAQVTTLDAEQDGFSGDSYFRLSEETCANISASGAFVATETPIRTGCRLMLEFELPSGESIEAKGRVVWSRVEVPKSVSNESTASSRREPAGIGIQFEGSAPEQTARLVKYLAKSLPRTRPAASTRVPSQTPTA